MTEEQKRKEFECSIQGFIKDFNERKYPNAFQALNGSIAYIIRHGIVQDLTTCKLEELIYVAKNEIAKLAAKDQIRFNEKDPTYICHNNEENETVQQFLKNPTKAIGDMIENTDFKNLDDHNDPDLKDFIHKYKNNANFIQTLCKNTAFNSMYNIFEYKKENSYDVLYSFESKLPNTSIEESMTRQKPSFFEKLLRRTSREYKNFKDTFNAYRDKNAIANGTDKDVSAAAMAYLKHKFPNLGDGELPTQEQINSLTGAGKERAMFCLKFVETSKENETVQAKADQIIAEVKNLDIQKNINNDKFQNNLKKDINEKEEDSIDDSIDSSKSIEVKENEISND